MGKNEIELALTEKLIKTFHLNTLERKNLSNGKVKLSFIQTIIKKSLTSFGWFPETWRPQMPFSGALLEKLPDNTINLFHKTEISTYQYKLIKKIQFKNIDQAIVEFLKITFDKKIDGIEIDYSQ